MQKGSDIGILGLGPMGHNLALNYASKGFSVSIYNRLEKGKEDIINNFIRNNTQKGMFLGFKDLTSFVASLEVPRKILIMVKAGKAVESVIERLIPLMEKEDIIIDGGNSHYLDTTRRMHAVRKYGIRYIGCGISGGSAGALNGPSMMPGGTRDGWLDVKDLFQSIAAKDNAGVPCCDWIGPEGSGHFVKMVHNGIEYALMQIIAEAYDIMNRALKMPVNEIISLFQDWNEEIIGGYLMEITAIVLSLKENDGKPLIDNVLDCAGQKGTGKDIAISGLEYDVIVSTITEAVNARSLSTLSQRKIEISQNKNNRISDSIIDKNQIIPLLFDSIHCAQLVSIIQGLNLLEKVSKIQSWDINIKKILKIWGKGCIIQSTILKDISTRLKKDTLNDIFIKDISGLKLENFSQAISFGLQHHIPLHVWSAALVYCQAIISPVLPANLIQLQREYFGSHGFEKVNQPGVICHLLESK